MNQVVPQLQQQSNSHDLHFQQDEYRIHIIQEQSMSFLLKHFL